MNDFVDTLPDERPLNEQEKIWAREQDELRTRMILHDTETWARKNNLNDDDGGGELRFVAGLDVSYAKEDADRGCAALVIYDLRTRTAVYRDTAMIHVIAEYSAGFLAFREIDFLLELYRRFRESPYRDRYEPQVWLLDGNGLLHPRRFGLACHFGVVIDRPTIGVAKNVHHFASTDRDEFKRELSAALIHRGDRFDIVDKRTNATAATIIGVALKTQDSVKNPLYVSCGHRISLETAIAVVLRCCEEFKNPEPIRLADQISREALRIK